MKQYCHIMIGPPASGKSTFAQKLQQWGYGDLVATDSIRHQLYGDPIVQGNWQTIEDEVFRQMTTALVQGASVIYDATNAKRPWRLAFLQRLETYFSPTQWESITLIGWQLTTPVSLCERRNSKRERRVPAPIIKTFAECLKQFPPTTAEGFDHIFPISSTQQLQPQDIEKRLTKVDRSQINRQNRTQHLTWHPYSGLLDFERLLHLIALILEYPGLGEWHHTRPQDCQQLLNTIPPDSITEITAFMACFKGNVYADPEAITADLEWLDINGFCSHYTADDLQELEHFPETFRPHTYSDREPFERLLKTIRFIVHHPLLPSDSNALDTLITALGQQKIIHGIADSAIRKDIEKVLKPYGILPNFSLRHGYFCGTGILSKSQLQQVFSVLQSQAQSLADPTALEVYEMLKDRMRASCLPTGEDYPVRAIVNRCMVDGEVLSPTVLSCDVASLEEAILSGQLLELNQVITGGRFPTDPTDFFQAWPLQLMFYNFAWYLGMEVEVPGSQNYFRVQRLDRLFQGKLLQSKRSLTKQQAALEQLQKLVNTSPGVFFGNSGVIQQQWLSRDPKQRQLATVNIELWFSDGIYRFIAEKTKRFPPAQMKLSPLKETNIDPKLKSLFSLKSSGDPQFPHRLQLKLPVWSLEDIDFRRWVLGFGAGVKVVKPLEFQNRICAIAREILGVYPSSQE